MFTNVLETLFSVIILKYLLISGMFLAKAESNIDYKNIYV
jgi:hypothetical protein